MKKIVFIFISILCVMVFQAYAEEHHHDHESMDMDMNKSSQSLDVKMSEAETYYCTMHPEIRGEKGGKCPKCGADLVLMKSSSSQTLERGEFMVDPVLVQRIGVKTDTVKKLRFGNNVRAYGNIIASSRSQNIISLRVHGWIENLNKSAVGDTVKKKDRLFDLNSPELLSAQADLLTAKHIDDKRLITSSINRLRQLGLHEHTIEEINSTNKPLKIFPIYANQPGVIYKLNIRNGDYIKPSMPLITIQDLSEVWVEADVPERYLSGISMGSPIKIIVSEIAHEKQGIVDYIYPTINPETRTGKVRIIMDNKEGILRPDSFVDVIFSLKNIQYLGIPNQAILRSTEKNYVIKSMGNGNFKMVKIDLGLAKSIFTILKFPLPIDFKMVKIDLGLANNEFTQITSGLTEGDEIVISGQFLIDAEASLTNVMSSMER